MFSDKELELHFFVGGRGLSLSRQSVFGIVVLCALRKGLLLESKEYTKELRV